MKVFLSMSAKETDEQIKSVEKQIAELDARREALTARLADLKAKMSREVDSRIVDSSPNTNDSTNHNESKKSQAEFPNAKVRLSSSSAEKIALFRSLFRGREDVYPRRWENLKAGTSGWQPVCANEWAPGLCFKPKSKCSDCLNRVLLPVTDTVIRNHLAGGNPGEPLRSGVRRDFTIGVYPLLTDDTCWFLAVDFDKAAWPEDVAAFRETCVRIGVPCAVERSRSGKGAHVWVFFSRAIPAALARRLGAYIITETMERRPEIGFESYDRFFPNQDTMPHGGFGNLIALPLQRKPRSLGNSIFIDENIEPYRDQWAFLSSVQRMRMESVESIVYEAQRHGKITGVRMVATDEDAEHPWTAPPSGVRGLHVKNLPEKVNIVLGNQIYVQTEGMPPALVNRLIRIAAFQNPEFHRAQIMRLSTFGKPRIISCAEDFRNHVGLPRGCREDVEEMFRSLGIKIIISDERVAGAKIAVEFQGALRPEQNIAADRILAHDNGVLAATTAFGKTVIGAYMIAARQANTLVLVHRRQLLDQWVAQLAAFLGVDKKRIGKIGGGKREPTGFIDVALIQSLMKDGGVDDIVAEYGHMIVDECHHITAASFEQVARRCKAKYVAGLSATVIRKDGHHPIIFMQCGPVRYRVDARRQAELRPFRHRVIVRKTEFEITRLSQEEPDPVIQNIYSAMISDEVRNAMIIADVVSSVNAGRSPVIITERKEHLNSIAEKLAETFSNVIVLQGGMGVKQRRAMMTRLEDIPEDAPRIIVATGSYLGEGFDDARLDTLFLAMPISWRGTLAQYAGRLHRLHDSKKEVQIYDYADMHVAVLAKMYERRLAGYRSIGYVVSD